MKANPPRAGPRKPQPGKSQRLLQKRTSLLKAHQQKTLQRKSPPPMTKRTKKQEPMQLQTG
jgi:hypothetical protein